MLNLKKLKNLLDNALMRDTDRDIQEWLSEKLKADQPTETEDLKKDLSEAQIPFCEAIKFYQQFCKKHHLNELDTVMSRHMACVMLQEALSNGYTDEDLSECWYASIWCNTNPKMEFPEWLAEFKESRKDKK
jgi:hypothetical protein